MKSHWFVELQDRAYARSIPALIAANRSGEGKSLTAPGTKEELRDFLEGVKEDMPQDFIVRLFRCETGEPMMTDISLKDAGCYGEWPWHRFRSGKTNRETLYVDQNLIGDDPLDFEQLTQFLWEKIKKPLSECRFEYQPNKGYE